MIQSNKSRDRLEVNVESLNAKVEQFQQSKDSCDGSLRALKTTLDDERRQRSSVLNNLESSIISSIQDRFSAIKL
jgi:hypothetical protein